MEYESTAHAKYLILYHLIFVCKYRKKLLVVYGEERKQIFEEIAAPSDFSCSALEGDQDHLHCLVKSKPVLSPVAIVRRLKQESTWRIWKRHEQARETAVLEGTNLLERWILLLYDWQRQSSNYSKVTLNNKGEERQFIHEAEDFVVFLPAVYKKMVALTMGLLFSRLQRGSRFVVSWISRQLDDKQSYGTIGALDGVRAIACLTILSFHIALMTHNTYLWSTNDIPLTGAILMAGGAGVTLFLVLSGFLLFLPYARALLFEQCWPDIRLFYLRRALRIMPAYYFALFLLVMFTHAEYLEPQNWQKLALFLFLFQDSTQMTYQQLNGPFWTLAVEWQFYLFLPLIAWGIHVLVRHMRTHRRIWGVMGCLIMLMVWGTLSRPAGDYFISHPDTTILVPRSIFNVFLFVAYGYQGKFLEDFAVGMLVSVLFLYLRDPTVKSGYLQRMQRLNMWIWRSGILLLVFVAMERYQDTSNYHWLILSDLPHMPSWLYEFGFALGYGCCVLAVLFDTGGLQWLFSRNLLRWLGTISYSVYIWHLPLLIVFLVHFGSHFGGINPYLAFLFYWSWAFLVIIPFCFLLYMLVEKPGMRLSDRLRRRMREQVKLAAMLEKRELLPNAMNSPVTSSTMDKVLL